MRIRLNGNDRDVSDGSDVSSLLVELKLAPDKVAVELNRRLLKTEKYSQPLREGDELEIVTFVGGG